MNYPISLDDSSPMASIEGPRKNYPRLHLQWDKKYDLPDDGEMTVRFHKCSETNTEGDNGTSQSVELDILTIEDVKAEKGEKKSPRREAEEALDSAMEDVVEGDY